MTNSDKQTDIPILTKTGRVKNQDPRTNYSNFISFQPQSPWFFSWILEAVTGAEGGVTAGLKPWSRQHPGMVWNQMLQWHNKVPAGKSPPEVLKLTPHVGAPLPLQLGVQLLQHCGH